ncbi:unnamed protein product [Mytilus edulis]|uniref:Endonuclease/exonuclease/phosphatase domain-containing protein n=1 Tax=Mytilus edulis TaxID=6550 RepID=A0A8S3VB04_MYTED|nr:unnamed protein product [Mytilus edulis]
MKKDAIKSAEVFPENFKICEIEWSKIKLKNSKDLFIASYYIPHRNMKDITNLKLSLEKLTTGKPKHIIIAGDFNCPDIDWINMEIKTGAPDKEVQQALMDLSIEHGLVQIHDKPTREGNLLDLVFTNNPSLIKSTGNAPGISDHDIVVTDSLIKPYYCKQRPQKRYMFGKANWDQIKTDINMITKDIYNHIHDMPIDKTWQTFKNGVQATIDTNVPS